MIVEGLLSTWSITVTLCICLQIIGVNIWFHWERADRSPFYHLTYRVSPKCRSTSSKAPHGQWSVWDIRMRPIQYEWETSQIFNVMAFQDNHHYRQKTWAGFDSQIIEHLCFLLRLVISAAVSSNEAPALVIFPTFDPVVEEEVFLQASFFTCRFVLRHTSSSFLNSAHYCSALPVLYLWCWSGAKLHPSHYRDIPT